MEAAEDIKNKKLKKSRFSIFPRELDQTYSNYKASVVLTSWKTSTTLLKQISEIMHYICELCTLYIS